MMFHPHMPHLSRQVKIKMVVTAGVISTLMLSLFLHLFPENLGVYAVHGANLVTNLIWIWE